AINLAQNTWCTIRCQAFPPPRQTDRNGPRCRRRGRRPLRRHCVGGGAQGPFLLTTATEIWHSVVMRGTSTEIPAVQRVIGLMSGTSADGVDAALVEIQGRGLTTQVRVLAHATYPYDTALR